MAWYEHTAMIIALALSNTGIHLQSYVVSQPRRTHYVVIYSVWVHNEYIIFWLNSPQWGRASSFTRFLDHTQWHTTAVGLLWVSDQLIAQTSTWQHTTLKTSILPVGFEPTIWAGERPQTYALDREATGTSMMTVGTQNKCKVKYTK